MTVKEVFINNCRRYLNSHYAHHHKETSFDLYAHHHKENSFDLYAHHHKENSCDPYAHHHKAKFIWSFSLWSWSKIYAKTERPYSSLDQQARDPDTNKRIKQVQALSFILRHLFEKHKSKVLLRHLLQSNIYWSF